MEAIDDDPERQGNAKGNYILSELPRHSRELPLRVPQSYTRAIPVPAVHRWSNYFFLFDFIDVASRQVIWEFYL